MERVVAYVDGFNLYFGLKEARWRRFYWLDVELLVRSLLKPHQDLVAVKYFTAHVSATPSEPDKANRQNTYLEALEAQTSVVLHYGHYLHKKRCCFNCGHQWLDHEEKGTDVNIAVEMLLDAFDDRFDSALLISADGDLASPIESIRRRFPRKRIVVAFPPKRHSTELEKLATASFTINRAKFSKSQLPQKVCKPDGTPLEKPATWE